MGVKKVSFGVLAFLFGSFALAKLTEGIEPVSIYLAQVMHNFSKAEADKLFQLGEQQLKSNQPSSALESFQKALPIYQQIKERLAEGHTHRSIGNAYYLLKEYTQAIAHYQQALSIAREIKNPELEARALLNLGRANAGQGNTAKAIDYYQQSLAIATANQNREVELKVLSSLGFNSQTAPKTTSNTQKYTYCRQSYYAQGIEKTRRNGRTIISSPQCGNRSKTSSTVI